jgi:hexulose-6-phosphate isomerase
MQGRLVPPEPGHFQAFPRERWRDEFAYAHAAGLDYIEWIHDGYGCGFNPIFTPEGRAELESLKKQYGIATPALCGDWFMEFPFLRCTELERENRELALRELMGIAHAIGANRLVLPMVDNGRMQTGQDLETIFQVLRRALPFAEQAGVEIHIEADLSPRDFAAFLERIPHPMLKVNWDSGNSSGLGYVASQEFAAYGNRIGSVHIKDRFRKPEGGVETRPLGLGSANFEDVFSSMREIGYEGGVTLQVARGEDNDEVDFIKQQLEFVRRFWH